VPRAGSIARARAAPASFPFVRNGWAWSGVIHWFVLYSLRVDRSRLTGRCCEKRAILTVGFAYFTNIFWWGRRELSTAKIWVRWGKELGFPEFYPQGLGRRFFCLEAFIMSQIAVFDGWACKARRLRFTQCAPLAC